jgi:hypothetical protein
MILCPGPSTRANSAPMEPLPAHRNMPPLRGPADSPAVDGRSSSGKTTLAARVQAAVAGSAVVHTDDIAWWHSRFD